MLKFSLNIAWELQEVVLNLSTFLKVMLGLEGAG